MIKMMSRKFTVIEKIKQCENKNNIQEFILFGQCNIHPQKNCITYDKMFKNEVNDNQIQLVY